MITLDDGIVFPFTFHQLTQAINVLDNQYGMMTASGLFEQRRVSSKMVEIRVRNGRVTVLGTDRRGAPGAVHKGDNEVSYFIEAPHFPWKDSLTPDDIQEIMAFPSSVTGGVDLMPGVAPRTQQSVMNDKLEANRLNGDITREYQFCSALKGVLKDGNGDTLFDYYTELGASQSTNDLKLGTEGTDVPGKFAVMARSMAAKAKGQNLTGIHVPVAGDLLDKILAHASVQAYFSASGTLAMEVLRNARVEGNQYKRTFEIRGVVLEEYDAEVELANGNSEKLIENGTGYAYPLGTKGIFAETLTPAHDVRAANKPGTLYWVSPEAMEHGAGVDLKFQMNNLASCGRPELVEKIYTSD
ncbi:major capsid protein [Maricaulis sp.]|uniref:major capsid protein n=1 Tax=Maricaulis sp. TaxID=1486257 RepID=UPI003A929252